MIDFTEDAKKLLGGIGGQDNINAVMHCVTRMRFILSDSDVVDIEAIESIPIVKGTFTQSGKFQVIIGDQVGEFYNDFSKIADVETAPRSRMKEAAYQMKTGFQDRIL